MPGREAAACDGVKGGGKRKHSRREKVVILKNPAVPSFLWVAAKVEPVEESIRMPIGAVEAVDEVTSGENRGQYLPREEKLILEDSIIPFDLLFASNAWSRERQCAYY